MLIILVFLFVYRCISTTKPRQFIGAFASRIKNGCLAPQNPPYKGGSVSAAALRGASPAY